MSVQSVEKINQLFKNVLNETQEFMVEGYCSYGNSKRTDEYRYSSLIDENYKFKIDILEGEELIDGIFYVLKVRFYSRKGVNEYRLKVIKVIEKFENKILINQNYFQILKNKIDKGYINIDDYLKNIMESFNKINIGFITFKTSIALDDVFISIEKEYKDLIHINRYDISIEKFENIFLEIKNDENNIDLWCITRGGGDLTFFNSLDLLKKLIILNKPILTALGHSTDKTLADICSDRSFETPTSLGNYLSQTLKKINSIKNNNKEYSNILLNKNELEKQINRLRLEKNKSEKVISIQKKELVIKENEIKSLKKLLEISLLNNDLLKKFIFNIKLIIYVVFIGIFIKIMLDII